MDTLDKFIDYISKTGSVAAPLLSHLEQRRSERAKFMSKEELASLEKRVRSAKGLPEGANYITLPHGRKGVVRTESGKSHLATILDASMRPPGRDVSSKVKTSSTRLRTTIFGVDPEGNLLHGFGNQGFYKFPGGGVDAGESIIDAAKRELLEEAGYDVESIEELSGLDTSDAVGATSAKGHMGHGSSLTKYLLARLGKRNESLLGSEGDAIGNLQTAPIDQVLRGLEGDILFGSGVAASNLAALSRVRDMLQNTSSLR